MVKHRNTQLQTVTKNNRTLWRYNISRWYLFECARCCFNSLWFIKHQNRKSSQTHTELIHIQPRERETCMRLPKQNEPRWSRSFIIKHCQNRFIELKRDSFYKATKNERKKKYYLILIRVYLSLWVSFISFSLLSRKIKIERKYKQCVLNENRVNNLKICLKEKKKLFHY